MLRLPLQNRTQVIVRRPGSDRIKDEGTQSQQLSASTPDACRSSVRAFGGNYSPHRKAPGCSKASGIVAGWSEMSSGTIPLVHAEVCLCA